MISNALANYSSRKSFSAIISKISAALKVTMIMRKFIFIILLFLFSSAYAEVSLKEYSSIKSSDDFKMYINGVGRGYTWSNNMLIQRGQKLIFCMPKKLSLGPDNYIDIVNKEIAANPSYPIATPVELILMMGLSKTFPCE